jgi:hypothetical protein
VKKLTIDLKIDNTLDDTPDEPAVKAINNTEEGMDVNSDVEAVDDREKNADLDVEEDEADEEVSQQDEDAQLSTTLAKETASLWILKGRETVTKTRNRISRPTRSRMNKTMKMITRI